MCCSIPHGVQVLEIALSRFPRKMVAKIKSSRLRNVREGGREGGREGKGGGGEGGREKEGVGREGGKGGGG